MMHRIVLALLATVAVVSKVSAQQKGAFEIGLFPNISYFDRSLVLVQGRTGPGARLGYFFTDQLAIEAEGAWVPVEGRDGVDVSYIPLRAKLAFNALAGEHFGFVFGAGYVQSLYKRDYDLSDAGATGSLGVRLGLGDVTSIRIDTYVDYIPSPDNGDDSNLNWGIQPGLSFIFGGNRGVRDRDADGVPDGVDECKNTPAGDKVDAKGCSLPKDADGDGVNDDKDRCPNTPAGVKVDEDGCQVLFEATKKTLILEGVNFQTGKADLTPESQVILDAVASSLVANEEIKVQVGGHTDNTGSAAVNKRLSAARAESVRQYLISKGVAATRLSAAGFGPSKPVASNKTAAGRAQNRRVELTRLN
jgi:outer membrane protein OmpA-like peptidoglycan-associated protein